MKAFVYISYGSPDVLKCEEIEKPTVGDNEVLIRVRAASVNPLDWHLMRGKPYIVRMMAGLLKPKVTRLGVDVAGQVDAVGRNVTRFKPGDEVFGACRGAFAKYARTSESALSPTTGAGDGEGRSPGDQPDQPHPHRSSGNGSDSPPASLPE